jgi:hypothetical protein
MTRSTPRQLFVQRVERRIQAGSYLAIALSSAMASVALLFVIL